MGSAPDVHAFRAAAAAVVLILASCHGESSDNGPPAGADPGPDPGHSDPLDPPGDTREWLTSEEMDTDDFPEQSPFHNGHFMPVGEHGPALHAFSGTLTLFARELGTDGPADFFGKRRDLFPDVPMRFISHDGHLVPLDRDRLFRLDDDSNWGLILSPGRVWSEHGDGNRSRASFPFTLVHSNLTQAHNGIASFLYDEASVSRLRVQVVQQIAPWEPHDYWGHLPVDYAAEIFSDAGEVIADFEDELAAYLPHEPWAAFEEIHGVPIEDFLSPVPPEMVSQSAILWDDILYVGGCGSRYGDYPYCREMRNAVFSVTKSTVAAVALLRLAQKFGPEVLDERIEDHVAVTAEHGGWAGVTFRDALNMASGVGDQDPESDATFGDENEQRFLDFQFADSTQGKLDVVFSYNNYPWEPGEKVRYNSINTFSLAAAIDAYLKTHEGPEASLHAMLVEEVYRPIGIRHAPMTRTIEADGEAGLPVVFSGYYPTLDEVARIARLLQNHGMHDGEAILHPELTASALYRSDEIGIEAPAFFNEIEHTRYQLSFWSWATQEGDDGCIARTPVMMGFGGNLVAVLANGATAFRFADAMAYSPWSIVETARVFGPLCE
jgi:CubicO group peptidase (beta-lactamase class C family)